MIDVKDSGGDAYIGKWVHPESTAPLEMVGRKGSHDIDWISDFIAGALQVDANDEVLDLCCGNGLITIRMSKKARTVVGVDFSEILLQQARAGFSAPNITYLRGDARALKDAVGGRMFDKAYISAAFQYFDTSTGRDVLNGLRSVVKPGGKLAILDIPDAGLKRSHQMRALKRVFLPEKAAGDGASGENKRFNGVWSRLSYLGRNVGSRLGLRKTDDMGQWWSRSQFTELAKDCGFVAVTLSQPAANPHHTYRFDAILTPRS